jgi:hypothetical protein
MTGVGIEPYFFVSAVPKVRTRCTSVDGTILPNVVFSAASILSMISPELLIVLFYEVTSCGLHEVTRTHPPTGRSMAPGHHPRFAGEIRTLVGMHKAAIHGPLTLVLARNSPTRLHEDPELVIR